LSCKTHIYCLFFIEPTPISLLSQKLLERKKKFPLKDKIYGFHYRAAITSGFFLKKEKTSGFHQTKTKKI